MGEERYQQERDLQKKYLPYCKSHWDNVPEFFARCTLGSAEVRGGDSRHVPLTPRRATLLKEFGPPQPYRVP